MTYLPADYTLFQTKDESFIRTEPFNACYRFRRVNHARGAYFAHEAICELLLNQGSLSISVDEDTGICVLSVGDEKVEGSVHVLTEEELRVDALAHTPGEKPIAERLLDALTPAPPQKPIEERLLDALS